MMAGEGKENELWYEFDNYYSWEMRQGSDRDIAVNDFIAWVHSIEFGRLMTNELREFLNSGTASKVVSYVNELSPFYIDIFEKYFGKDYDLQTDIIDSSPWNAFVDFGLGTLYDPREPRSFGGQKYYVHVMDIGTGGYMRWHRFNWVGSILLPQKQRSPFAPGRWLYLDRLVGMAGELHSRTKPRQSSLNGLKPENPPNGDNITMAQIREISDVWLKLNFEDIEKKLAQLEDWTPIPA